eukprot:Selendium_serpulae@DN6013_c0_g2_i3.p1
MARRNSLVPDDGEGGMMKLATQHLQRKPSASVLMMRGRGGAMNIGIAQILSDKQHDDDCVLRRTKIVCTMGPRCTAVKTIVEMIDSGMRVARLNFSHGDHESHGNTLKIIREAQQHRPEHLLGIMLDTKGPEIRTGFFKDGKKEIHLKADQKLKLMTDYSFKGDEEAIACSYPQLTKSVGPGSKVLIADGSLVCQVDSVHDDHVMVTVKNDATIGERKILGEGNGSAIKVISKIENVEGIKNFDEIVEASDAIMIARGDLGMEIPSEKVFLAQKRMIAKCNVLGKPVITATQMLESMTKNPRPTRAEVTDVANAVLDGTDCVMLSGETANGAFPVDAVKTMSDVCLEAESCLDYSELFRAICAAVPRPVTIVEAVACAAVASAEDTNAALCLALTETGYTARLISKYRPRELVLAASASEVTIRQLQIQRGVIGIKVESFQGTDIVIRGALKEAVAMGLVNGGDNVVAVHGMMEEVAGGSNLLKIVSVPMDS